MTGEPSDESSTTFPVATKRSQRLPASSLAYLRRVSNRHAVCSNSLNNAPNSARPTVRTWRVRTLGVQSTNSSRGTTTATSPSERR